MRRVLGSILITISLLLGPTIPVASASTCTQLVTFGTIPEVNGGNGWSVNYCAQDLQASGNPFTPTSGASFNNGQKYPGSTYKIDNTIARYKWPSGTTIGMKVRLWDSYNYGGTYMIEITKISTNTGWINLPTSMKLKTGSFIGCGTSCADEPT
jgi:hypothetical protein